MTWHASPGTGSPDRSRGREPLSVCRRRGEARPDRSTTSSRRSTSAVPSLVRSAAKNFQQVLVVVDPADYPRPVRELGRDGGPSPRVPVRRCGRPSPTRRSTTTTIAEAMASRRTCVGGHAAYAARLAPTWSGVSSATARTLTSRRSGSRRLAAGAAGRCTRARSCPTRTCSIWTPRCASRSSSTEPAAVVIKHTNPCGVATGSTAVGLRARKGRRCALRLRRHRRDQPPLDAETAAALTSTFIEAVIAPSLHDEAREMLAAKANLRVVTADYDRLRDAAPAGMRRCAVFSAGCSCRSATACPRRRDLAGRGFSARRDQTCADRDDEWQALRFAWRVCAHVKSNTVIFTAADRTLAIGCGADEPRRCGERRRHEGARPAPTHCADRSPRPMRSSRSATASMPSPPPERRPSCSRAARSATPR
jgi:phosphoribosylaminoimidazolecarboxamide formyltransferase / IMP cyclohydrolase